MTDSFECYGECVSSQPSILAFNGKSDRFEINKVVEANVYHKYGCSIKIQDSRKCLITLKLNDGSEEHYNIEVPDLIVGNIIIVSKRYIEPTATRNLILNTTHGITCTYDMKARSTMSDYNTHRFEAKILDVS